MYFVYVWNMPMFSTLFFPRIQFLLCFHLCFYNSVLKEPIPSASSATKGVNEWVKKAHRLQLLVHFNLINKGPDLLIQVGNLPYISKCWHYCQLTHWATSLLTGPGRFRQLHGVSLCCPWCGSLTEFRNTALGSIHKWFLKAPFTLCCFMSVTMVIGELPTLEIMKDWHVANHLIFQ